MKFKTLLLGTAAALSVVGGAQAADLAVAEPVDYVKVCDAYGVGYWYIPGTDTCIRIGGYVKLDTLIYNNDHLLNFSGLYVDPGAPTNAHAANSPNGDNADGNNVSRVFPRYDDYSARWQFATETELNVTAQSMTDYGPLTAFIAYRGLSNNSIAKGTSKVSSGNFDLGGPLLFLDTAYLKIGPVGAGFMASTFDYGGGFTYDLLGDFRHDVHQDQVNFGWNWGSWGLWFSLEDPRNSSGGSEFKTGDFPDFVAAITGAGAGWDWKFGGAVEDTIYGTGYAGMGGITYTWAGGSAIRLQGAVANDFGANYVSNSYIPNNLGGTFWSVLGSAIYFWTPAFSTAVTGGYSDGGGDNDALWAVSAGGYWTVAKNATVGAEFQWLDGQAANSSVWDVKIELKRSFGS